MNSGMVPVSEDNMMQEREFPCDVWFVRFSKHCTTRHYPHSSPIEKQTASAETDRSVTTCVNSYGKAVRTCHHKSVMERNSQWFFYSEQEALDFYASKLNEALADLNNQIAAVELNRTAWVK